MKRTNNFSKTEHIQQGGHGIPLALLMFLLLILKFTETVTSVKDRI